MSCSAERREMENGVGESVELRVQEKVEERKIEELRRGNGEVEGKGCGVKVRERWERGGGVRKGERKWVRVQKMEREKLDECGKGKKKKGREGVQGRGGERRMMWGREEEKE
ncbi:octapeptide-repeat protein T2-like [Abrus precatorius]|uniref:Octapeptide-repeat protein T2-like n=1 Tax=Abrus precatorius TaxID=3816 RepID=A0A8B8K519_ABRPR|nr:octapeptide-repeat protein T2-like [Abrus precatorius]